MIKISSAEDIIGSLVGDNSLCMEIDKFRMNLFQYDVNLLADTNIKINVEDFKDAPDGRFAIQYMNIDFDCLFKRNHESNRLYVILNGSRQADSPPVFKRWSYYKYMNGSMLNIDDPMCKLHRELLLGWYYGTETESYCDYIVEIVQEFAKQNGFKDVVFFASSGGGYAALYCACKMRESMAVVINPQINLSLWHWYSQTFEDITGLNLTKEDKFGRNNLCELIANANHSKFLLIENCESDVDMVQLDDLLSKLNPEAEVHYGISELKKNIICWIYQAKHEKAGGAHIAQEYPAIFWGIEYLIDHFNNTMCLHDFVLLLNESWYVKCETEKITRKNSNLFLMMNQWVKLKQDGKNLASYFEKNGYYKIAIYGMSHAGERLVEELKNTEIKVKYGVDINADKICSSLDVYSVEDELAEVDAVIVTPIFNFNEIKEGLSRKLDCAIISLEDILYVVSETEEISS